MAFPIIPRLRSGATGNPTSLELGELATNTATGELFLGGDGGVMLLNPPTSAGTTVTEHTGDGSTVAFAFTGYNGTADGGYLVSVGGIDQPPSKYSVSNDNGGTITFVEAPVAGELISIRAIVAGSGGGADGNATSIQSVAVSATAPSTNQALVYNGTDWAPADVDAAKLQGVDVSTTDPTDGQFLIFNSVSLKWEPTSQIPEWKPGTAYALGAVVSRNGVGFRAAGPNYNYDPMDPNGFWDMLTGPANAAPVDQQNPVGWIRVWVPGISGQNTSQYIPVYT